MANPLSIVIAGCGDMSYGWLRVLTRMEDVAIAGLVDLDGEAAQKLATAFELPNVKIGIDLSAMLGQLKPDIVCDVTVPAAHHAVTRTALAHGCHVLGEKPMADTMDHAREMLADASQAKRIYAVTQNRRYHPGIRRIRRVLKNGQIGGVTAIHSDFFMGAHIGGFRDHMKNVLLLDMAIHTFDAARAITGADPVSVYCKEWNPSNSWFDHDASAVAIFEMTGGIVYTYRGSWVAEGVRTSWESAWRIIGEKGSLYWDGYEDLKAEAVSATEGYFSTVAPIEIPALHDEDRIGGHAGVIHEFMACVRQGTSPETVCTDNVKSLAMVFGAIESAKTGKKVEITP